jgi:DNA-binding XRE family transcriptional regulator
MIIGTPPKNNEKPKHAKDLPVQTPELLLYSEISDRLKLYVKETGISHKQLAKKIGIARSTLIETMQLDHYPKSLIVSIRFMKFLDMDIDNFIYEKTNLKEMYLNVPAKDVVRFILNGLKRNIMYRKILYTPKVFADMMYLKTRDLNRVMDKSKYTSLASATKIALAIKKNFKRLAYDGHVPLKSFKPF